MDKKLYLLDGMALVYRAHFALIARPIFTSRGVNTSALYGFTQTLLDIIRNRQPTHLAVAFDTAAPTQRHIDFPEYKIQREEMPEDISFALPHVRRMLEAFRIPVLTCDGYEADDIIGTLVKRAEQEGFTSYMVTADKDFGQLVTEKTFLYRPSRMGDAVEILGVPEILTKWGIEHPRQVVDIMALWGDTSDNIPGVPGIGEKTASKLIAQYGSVENLLAHSSEAKGKLREKLETFAEQARLSKRLATINCESPCDVDLESLRLQEPDNEELKRLFIEFEFNSIGRRLFGDDFKAGRGFPAVESELGIQIPAQRGKARVAEAEPEPSPVKAPLKRLADVPHEYRALRTPAERAALLGRLRHASEFAFRVETTGNDPKQARLLGLAFAIEPRAGFFVPLPSVHAEKAAVLGEFRELLEDERIGKIGHDLKFAFSVLKWHGITARGKLFDSMLAHSLIEPDMRHTLDYLSEACLGYCLLSRGERQGNEAELDLAGAPDLTNAAVEAADVGLQLRAILDAELKAKGQERVYHAIEAPLVPVLVEMEHEGVRVDAGALAEFSALLSRQMADAEKAICGMAQMEFNVNSPRQLGQVLFEVLKICDKPKRTKTGQYATDEQTLQTLASEHEIVRQLIEYRGLSKLKSTYADTLPAAIFPTTGRVHTTYNQTATSTGRLNSQNPNLQNIPIRTEQGREIRKAFIPRNDQHLLLSADYSQIELRIIAALSQEKGLIEAFQSGMDVHTATAAKVFGVFPDLVTDEMRRKAKMVNYGIAYGMSAFGLSQRLAIPRREAAEIIEQYFNQFPGIRKYMSDTIEFCKTKGYVETITGRRRYLRDIRSANATIRAAAERNAINAPIQGTAADMIKLAMIRIHERLHEQKLKTRMLLQVHDELVFDLYRPEQEQVMPMVEEVMRTALVLEVPVVVEMGVGKDWLEAH
jgi:DNA polymerase I